MATASSTRRVTFCVFSEASTGRHATITPSTVTGLGDRRMRRDNKATHPSRLTTLSRLTSVPAESALGSLIVPRPIAQMPWCSCRGPPRVSWQQSSGCPGGVLSGRREGQRVLTTWPL